MHFTESAVYSPQRISGDPWNYENVIMTNNRLVQRVKGHSILTTFIHLCNLKMTSVSREGGEERVNEGGNQHQVSFPSWRGIRRLWLETEVGFNPALSPCCFSLFHLYYFFSLLSLCLWSVSVLSFSYPSLIFLHPLLHLLFLMLPS